MIYINIDSKRQNIFRKVYDHDEFKNVLLQKGKLPKFPFIVDVELTNRCNLSCEFCDQRLMKRQKGSMSREILEKVIDECACYKTPVRFIRWGEPFLHPDIITFARYVKLKRLPLHITNNGLVIDEDDMTALVEMELDSIIFSFQGVTESGYRQMRNNDDYAKLCGNVTKLVKIRGERPLPFIHISSTVTDEREDDIKKFVKYWDSIVDSVGIGKTNLARVPKNNMLSKKWAPEGKTYRPCVEVYQKLSVDWDGKVTCCCADFDNFLSVGDIKRSSLSSIWNESPELKSFRELLDRNMHKSLTLCSTCYRAY